MGLLRAKGEEGDRGRAEEGLDEEDEVNSFLNLRKGDLRFFSLDAAVVADALDPLCQVP